MSKTEQPQPKYRKDYKPTPYLVDKVDFDFNLNEESTKVVARSHVKPNHEGAHACLSPQICAPHMSAAAPLAPVPGARRPLADKSTNLPVPAGGSPFMELDGRSDMVLTSVSINGKALNESDYERVPDKLTIKSLPEGEFDLEIVTTIKPQENTLLEGLYKSGGNFCSQVRATLQTCRQQKQPL